MPIHATQPVIAVFGATGTQGGGLVRALLRDPHRRFAVRAITRQPGSAAARALACAGAQLVAADLDQPDSLAPALEGAHGVFGVTNFWEHFNPERDLRQAAHLARAAAAAKVQHIVWSTLEDTRRLMALDDPRMPTLMGRYKVPHMDLKAEADACFAGLPVTFVLTSFYWDNLVRAGLHPRRDAQGQLVWVLPIGSAHLPGVAGEDIGACVAALFARGKAVVGQRIGLAGDVLSGAEMAAAMSHTLGEPVCHVALPPAEFARLPFPGAAELANMFQFKRDFESAYCAARPAEAARALYPGLRRFSQWLGDEAAALRAVVGSAPASDDALPVRGLP
ncbi:NmrA-like family protein [Variovorax paradoxus B4]|uniref:NmrA-like family protein n=1 Tax=Variovorax paradoxus B4 TaxID=1246301 RepID=T1X5J9_VARPD|nr:NmrA/HSCARG family protein [Variovorax paradoxus]AGU48182.1 NmrA-like family protein [Variovorax paradoxus B4]